MSKSWSSYCAAGAWLEDGSPALVKEKAGADGNNCLRHDAFLDTRLVEAGKRGKAVTSASVTGTLMSNTLGTSMASLKAWGTHLGEVESVTVGNAAACTSLSTSVAGLKAGGTQVVEATVSAGVGEATVEGKQKYTNLM